MGKVAPKEMRAARDLLPVFERVAAAHEWPEELGQALEPLLGPKWIVWTLMAICSRESRFGLALDKSGRGDGGHGLGLMQIDDRSFPEFARRDYRDPAVNIVMGANVLQGKYDYLADHFELCGQDYGRLWWAAVAAYNCGEGNVRKALERGRGQDAYTTGRDYSGDVKGRAAFLARELGGFNA